MDLQAVKIARRIGDDPVLGVVFGTWAATQRLPEDRGFHEEEESDRIWTVTHVPSGYHIGGKIGYATREEAVAVARLLEERYPIPLVRNSDDLEPEAGWIVEAIVAEALEVLP